MVRGRARDRSRLLKLVAAVAALGLVAGVTAGCGGSSANAASHPPPEKAKITIAVIPSTDMAPLWVAQSQGYFTQEGLDPKIVTMGGGGDVMTALLTGKVDFAFVSYPLVVQAQQKGKADLRIVADASAAKPDAMAVVVARNSPLRSPADLEGKRVAVTSTGSMADLAVMAGMRGANADPSGIKWEQMKFPDMLPKLAKGDIDAAFLVEPFLSIAQAKLGVWTVMQPSTGRLDGIALTGYAAQAKTAKAYPNTVAAFQRAVQRAHREAGTRKGDDELRDALIKNAKVPAEIAPVLHLPAYPITTDPTRLQRIPDLLLEYGMIPKPFDIKTMIVPNSS